jgi:aminobenzoyl-glutamate transport protein
MAVALDRDPGVEVPPASGTGLLDRLERLGNRVPDPVVLFLLALAATFMVSGLLAGVDFGLTDPRTSQPLQVNSLLTTRALAAFFAGMTPAFVSFPPLGMVLVMVIGVGVAERSGFVGAVLRGVLAVAPRRALVPLVVIVCIAGHVLSDSALVLLLPLAGALFYVAGRHPLAGIVCALAPLLGVLFANLFPSALDAILAGFTEGAARIIDPAYRVNPLSNHFLGLATACLVVPVTWWLVVRVVEPRLAAYPVDGDPSHMPAAPPLTRRENWALVAACVVGTALLVGFGWVILMPASPFRAPDGSVTGPGSPTMLGMIPLMLVFTLVPSLTYGVAAGTLRDHREAIAGMTGTMASMAYYIVMVFFAAQFTKAFADSNLGALIALEGAKVLRALGAPTPITLLGVVALTAGIDVLVPSASAKWALLGPIFVPMLMAVGVAPELTQASFRIGDGPVNLLTPLMPYFPLVLAFCRRYVTGFGVGSLMSLLLPFGASYLALQVLLLLVWWAGGLPLGVDGRHVYP